MRRRLSGRVRLGYLIGVSKEPAPHVACSLKVPHREHNLSSPGLILTVGAVLVLVMVAAESITALSITVLDGGAAVLALGGAALAGGWLVQLLGLGRAPWAERLILGAGLGVGALSLLVLGLGWAGWLSRSTALVLVGALAMAGIVRLVLDVRRHRQETASPPPQDSDPSNWLWLLVCPFLAIAILAACLPPGILWGGYKAEEAYGYDVLEYHLAVPKIFFEQGRVGFLPNNVYSNFPLNSEMLSLLMMTLRGDPVEAAFMAQMANVFLAGLFAAAAWLAGRAFSARVGLVAGVAALTAPWTAYLAGIAYVEAGMMAMGMCALAVVLNAEVRPQGLGVRGLAAGVLAGLSAGFKYTAIPLIAFPAAMLVVFCRRPLRQRALGLAALSLGLLIAFAPWLLRNWVNTRNPLFPMAYSILGAKPGVWDAELEARWQKAHGREGIAEADKSVLVRLVQRTLGDYRMGGVLVVLAVVGALRSRDRWTLALTGILVLQTAVWVFATHQYARFAAVMLLPLAVLAGRAFEAVGARRPLLIGLLIAGTTWNLYRLGRLYYDHTRVEIDSGTVAMEAYGHTNWFVTGQGPGSPATGAVNNRPPATSVMLVGEARSFYIRPPFEYATVFNHHPLADAVRKDPDPRAVLTWLANRGTRYVLVHWAEMERLRRTYGFYPEIDARLFERLVEAGLTVREEFLPFQGTAPYATLYEVPLHE